MSENDKDPQADQPTPEAPKVVIPDATDLALVAVGQALPQSVFALVVDGVVLFPGMMLPVMLAPGSRGQATIDQVETHGGSLVAVLARRPRKQAEQDGTPGPGGESGGRAEGGALDPGEVYHVGCLGRVMRALRLPDGQVGVLLSGIKRLRVSGFKRVTPVPFVDVEYPDEIIHDVRLVEALDQSARKAFEELIPLHSGLPDEMRAAASQIEGAGQFADFCGGTLPMDLERRQGFLSTFELDARLRSLMELLERELDLARLSVQARDEIRKKVETQQREMYLREQLQAIRRELGEEVDARDSEVDRFAQAIKGRGLPAEASKRATEELERLKVLPAEAAE